MKHKVREVKLKNGVSGLLIDVADASVMSMELNFRAGDFRSPKGKWEVAHVLEHMVFGANKKYPKARLFQAELQKNGAFMNASTSSHDLNYIVECADFEWDRILGLVGLSVSTPLLSDEEFLAETGNVREELTSDLNNNFRQLIINARQKFGLVSLDDNDRIDQLANISVSDIRQFYKETHESNNLRFVVSGNVFSRQTEIEKLFSNLKLEPGKRADLPDEKPMKYREVFYIEKPDLKNMYFFFNTFAMKDFSQQDEDALSLVDVMLTATLHSRILGEARERGLAYSIASSFSRIKKASGWWFGAELNPEKMKPVFEIIVRELKRLKKGVLDDKDLEAAKQYSLGRYQRSAQTVGGIMHGYSGGYYYDGRIDDYYSLPDRIKATTKSDIIDIVKRMFTDDIWGLTIMGTDKAELASKLNKQLSVLWK